MPSEDPLMCAMVYSMTKQMKDFDYVKGWGVLYFDYSNEEIGSMPLVWSRQFSRYILHLGLFFYLLGFKINKTLMISLVFLLNTCLHMLKLYMPLN